MFARRPTRPLLALALAATLAPWLAPAARAEEPPSPWDVPPEAPPAPGPVPVEWPPPESAPPEAAPAALAPTEVRETWDAQGRLVRRLMLADGALQAETTFTYDADGRLVEDRTVAGGTTTVETWTRDADGNPMVRVVQRDGDVLLRETSTWADGLLVHRVVEAPDRTQVTTWAYDDAGRATLVETRAADGALAARTVADREPPPRTPVPFTVAIDGGVATDSDVRTTSVRGGFALGRKPTAAQYAYDPIEVSATGSYARTSSRGTVTDDALEAGFGLDYNRLVGPVTLFLFTRMERNPVANLDVDVIMAPIGAKIDIVPEGLFTLDASFAPVWNFRSVAVDAGGECDGAPLAEDGHCAFSKLRGSFRLRAALGNATVRLADALEFLPTLNPEDGDLVGALGDEAIVRNTATLEVELTGHLTLKESVVFVRDPLLAAQADCAADPDALLCDGLSLRTGTTLGLAWKF